MFKKTYKVKGEDVNDYMIMQDYAYNSYIILSIQSLLFENGYTKQRLCSLKKGTYSYTKNTIDRKHLMFTQSFSINQEFLDIDNYQQKVKIRSRFFNTNNELCLIVVSEFYWFDSTNKKMIIQTSSRNKNMNIAS